MPTQISGSAGVSKVQDGVVVTADIADLAITPEKMSQKLTSGVAVAATGTAVDFLGIPSWAKRVTVLASNLSSSGTSIFIIRLGTAGGVVVSGYTAVVTTAAGTQVQHNTGVGVIQANAASSSSTVLAMFELVGNNTWVVSGSTMYAAAGVNDFIGEVTLPDTLDRVRVTTVNGTDTFDAGLINIMWE